MTQAEVAQSIIRQLRLLDPSVSAEIGTPERKIIDVVAQQVAERSVDLNQLRGALDIDSKYGIDLDNFLGIFRFGRQQGTYATSFVTFYRDTPSTYNIFIPSGTVVTANTSSGLSDGAVTSLLFRTTQSVTLPAGSLSITAPVTATRVGQVGNVAIGEINGFGAASIAGINRVRNEIVGQGGVNPETDDQLKARFKNTVFRNVSGTHDQFLADALSIQFVTKANVVGPISRYVETIQVPENPDSDGGNGETDQWSSALSSIPYSKYTYKDIPHYIVDSQNRYFFRQDVDFAMNVTPLSKNKGDAYRQRSVIDSFGQPIESSLSKPNITFKNVLSRDASNSINLFDSNGDPVRILKAGQTIEFEHSYMSESSRNDFEHGIMNCVDVFVNGVNEQYADTVLPLPSMSDSFIVNPASVRHYDNYRRYGEPTHRPVVGNLFQPLFSQPSIRLPESIAVGQNTFLNGVHFWAVEDVTELRGTVRARNGIEWNTNLPGKLPADSLEGPYNGSSIATLSRIEDSLETENRLLTVNRYTFNSGVNQLQIKLEGNKQITTDVLAHAATMRYFKVDVAIMYTMGASESITNAAISRSLSNHFNSQYFGTYIQLSDVLQAIKETPGVDNARWSIDVLREDPNFNGDFRVPVDSQGRARWPITECDQNGRPLTRAISERVQQNKPDNVADWDENLEYQELAKVKHQGKYWIALTSSGPDTNGDPDPDHEPGVDPLFWREALEGGTRCIDRVYLTGNPTGGTFVLSYKLFNAGIVEYPDSPNTITKFGPPSSDIGNVDDLYYDKDAEKLYGPKTVAGWGTGIDFKRYESIDMTLPYDATAEDVERKLREQQGDFATSPNEQTLRVTGSGTPDNPWIIEWLAVQTASPEPLYAVSNLWGDYSWDTDFAIKDDELPATPLGAVNTDSSAGLVVMVKTQNTWDQS